MSEMNSVKISVIIPAYNAEEFLSETLRSVLAQSISEWECVIVDNGSIDGTKRIAEGFVKQDTRFKYHFCEQRGVSFARNLAVSLSKGKYILPLDSDDKIGTSYLEKGIRKLEEDSNLKLVYCDAELFGASQGKWILPPYSLKELLIENSIFCSAIYRKTDFEQTKGYNENMHEGFEDWDFWIRMLKDGSMVYKIPETLFYYRIRKNSRNNVLDKEKQLRLRKQIFLNHEELYLNTFKMYELIYLLHVANSENSQLKHSFELKIGALFIKPFRFLKKLLTR
jgi:glycosyltransferase involved in cell wall biosynthesis